MAAPQLDLDRSFDPAYGEGVTLAEGLVRVTAPNSGPFTFHGTNTFIVGGERIAIVDPGPDIESHIQAIVEAIDSRPVDAIVITHTHMDHTEGLTSLQRLIEAPVVGCAPHRAARALAEGEVNALDAAADKAYVPDRILSEDDTLVIDGVTWRTIETPGHTMNHLVFLDEATGTLLSSDHIMAWSTSVVAPPDGRMSDYMASLTKMQELDIQVCHPGHGGPVRDPATFVQALIAHRENREKTALRALERGAQTIQEMVPNIYIGLDPKLYGAAGLSLFAHLEDLVERRIVLADGPPTLSATYQLA